MRGINLAVGAILEISPMPGVVTMRLTAWIAKDGPAVTKLRAAINEAIELMNKEPAKYSAATKAQYFPQMDQVILDEAFKDYSKASYEKVLIPEAQIK